MSFTIHEEKQYEHDTGVVYDAVLGAIAGLEGKVDQEDRAQGELSVKFHKTILGKVLGDRTHMDIAIKEQDGGTAVKVECYPLDAIGKKLMFGARKGVSQTVVNWFYAHLEHRLPK